MAHVTYQILGDVSSGDFLSHVKPYTEWNQLTGRKAAAHVMDVIRFVIQLGHSRACLTVSTFPFLLSDKTLVIEAHYEYLISKQPVSLFKINKTVLHLRQLKRKTS